MFELTILESLYYISVQDRKFLKMGENQSTPEENNYSHNLIFVQCQEDPHFSFIDIFKTKEAPYQYIMDFKKNFIEDNERTSKYLRLMSQLKNMEHKNLSKIHASELVEENQVCIKHKKIHTYCNYYNFTLEKAIAKKKSQEGSFSQSQLLYIMGCLLDVGQYLQKYGIALAEYRSKSIFLSPEGYIKLFLLQLEEQNKHSCYYKVLSEKSLLEEYIFAPEQLYYLNNLEYEIKYDPYKADVFAIGMVILELITLDKLKFYYNENKSQLKMDRIAFDIASVSKTYSETFIHLLRGCLQTSPQYRLSLTEANQQINRIKKSMKSITYCIRLQQDQEKGRKNTKREIAMSIKGQHILQGLQKKLTPSPITTMSSSISSAFKVESRRDSGHFSQNAFFKL